MLTLTRTDTIATHTGTNGSAGSWVGSTMTITATGATWLWYVPVPAVAGQVLADATVTVTVPAGSVGGSYYAMWVFQDAAAGITGTATGPTVTAPGPGTYALTVPATTVPAGTVVALLRPGCNAGGTAGRKLTEVLHVATTTANPDDITAASVSRDLARTADVATSSGATYLIQGPIGAQAGALTYLVSTWSQLAALDAVYRQPGAVVISGAEAGALAGFTHYGVGVLRSVAERAVPGALSRWLVSLDVRAI